MGNIRNSFNKLLFAYPDKTERIIYLLIFLFPIAGMSVRHWITNIFNLLVLISLFTLRKPREPLLKQEKIFLWICAAYFSMFIISALANGWGQAQTYYLGTELRFIMVIPLYILLRRYSDCSIWLLRGAIIGGFFLFGQAYYDVYIMGKSTALGIYSKNIIGPFAVVIGFWSTYYLWENFKLLNWNLIVIIILSISCAFLTSALSGSRGSYVGFVITSIFSIMFFSKPRWMFLGLVSGVLVTFLFYQNSSIIQRGMDTATSEIQSYFQAKDHTRDVSSTTSVGVRLEMIRTGMLIIKDNPIIGIGSGNYLENTKIYTKSGKAHPDIEKYASPHNAFLEVATAKGLMGLVTLILLLYYPAFLFVNNYKKFKATSILGLTHIVAISAFSLTDHSVVLMNNYTSILLLGIAIFLSSHLKSYK